MRSRMKKILVKIMVPLALIVFSVALWFAGPLIVVAGYAPFAGFWTRFLILLVIWATYLGVIGFRYYKRRKAEKALEDAVVGEIEAGDNEELSQRMAAKGPSPQTCPQTGKGDLLPGRSRGTEKSRKFRRSGSYSELCYRGI